ncbi:Solute carrier family 23 member 2 [Nymphon striatum]|nr:Solute carrier family 23 member 2 [Nymphon striatum]KAG1649644.1 Solute carrier family 23 member 2 [Nymphon striatum]
MIGSVIGLPFILIPKLCMDFHEEAVGLFISNVMFVSGVVTFLQTTFGIRLPIAQGPALAFMAPTLAILDLKQWRCPSKETMQLYNITTEDLWKPRLLEVQGALIVSSLVQVFIGIFGISGFLVKFITPLTIVPTITLIGLSLFKVSTEISSLNWGISELTSILVIIMLLYLRNKKLPIPVYNRSESKWFIKWIPFFSFYAFSVAILIAWLVCHIFTITNLVPEGSSIRTDSSDAISRARWINIPYPGHVGMPTVSIYSTFGLISAVIAGIVKSIGDYYTCAKITGTDAPPKYAINRAVAMEGIGSIISGLCGPGIGVTSFTGNIGAIGLTKLLYETRFNAIGPSMRSPEVKSVRTAFDRKEKGESAALMEEVMKCLESLESLWGDFESGLGVTARLWSMYIDMMLILRRYIHAERAGLWQQHLQEVRNMLPYTIASGHSKYMSCLPIYLNEMQKLPETPPEVHEEFAAGKFTVHQTAGDFNGVWTDLAMAFIQPFNTLGSSTFGQLQERYRDKFLNMKPRHCTEVHFVGDQYDFELKSLKCDERQRRESNINLPEYVPADSMKIPDWKTLLSNPCNRTNMLSYLASRWSQEASWPAGFCLVLGVNAQATRVTQTEHTDVDELYCPNHEEADTRIFAHIASCDDNNVFVIQATDTDIIFLAMYHFPRLPNVVELWVEKNDLFLSIHDLVNELAKAVGKDVLALTDTLLISYILSSCDSVSYPFKRGKKRTVKVALEHVDKHPTLSNCIQHESGPSAHDQVITEARSFFCDLYGKPGYLSLDKLRAHLFASSKLDLRSLPPTEDAFHFHVLRSLCQICLYKQASFSNPVLLPPEEYGRIVDGDRLIPVMKSKPPKPSAAKLKYCKCKKKPNCLRNCPCAKAAVPCIIACACNGDREKCGRLLTDHYDDDDDDDDDDDE